VYHLVLFLLLNRWNLLFFSISFIKLILISTNIHASQLLRKVAITFLALWTFILQSVCVHNGSITGLSLLRPSLMKIDSFCCCNHGDAQVSRANVITSVYSSFWKRQLVGLCCLPNIEAANDRITVLKWFGVVLHTARSLYQDILCIGWEKGQ